MRDVKLKDGAVVLDSTMKNEVKVESVDAVLQRIEIALSVNKGCFPYNRLMGVTVPLLDLSNERDVLNLEMYINEAIYSLGESVCKIKSVNKERNTVVLEITVEGDVYEREVKLSGKL